MGKQTKQTQTQQTVRFVVKQAFRYGDRAYKPGDEFEPEGKRMDELIIRNKCRTEPNLKKLKEQKEEVIDER